MTSSGLLKNNYNFFLLKCFTSNYYLLFYLRHSLLIERPALNSEIHIKIGGDHGGKSFKVKII